MSRVLWLGDAGVSTGFGVVINNVGKRLAADYGHEIHVLASGYRGDPHGSPMHLWRANTEDPIDTYGQKRIVELLAKIQPDVVVVLNDPHVITRLIFHNDYDEQHALRRYRPLITYFTMDGENLPETFKVFARYSRAVAMSVFGQTRIPGSDLIYHGIDTEVFRPATLTNPLITSTGRIITSKAAAKDAFGYDPNRFLILRVDRNGWRKDYGATWKALVPIVAAHDDVDVHFHCAGNDIAGGPLMPELWSRDMATAERFHLSRDLKMPDSDLATLYNAADMFVTTSMGEGFGLTLLESLACGVPVVAQDCSAITEVVGDGGVLVDPGPFITSPSGQDLRLADIPRFTNAVEVLYQDAAWRSDLSKRGLRHAQGFGWDAPVRQWDQLITQIHLASLTQGSDPGEDVSEATASPA